MKLETARMLIDSMANTLGIALDNRNKLTAFESLLKKRDPSLFDEYSAILEKVRNNPPTSLSPEGFAILQSKLVQD